MGYVFAVFGAFVVYRLVLVQVRLAREQRDSKARLAELERVRIVKPKPARLGVPGPTYRESAREGAR